MYAHQSPECTQERWVELCAQQSGQFREGFVRALLQRNDAGPELAEGIRDVGHAAGKSLHVERHETEFHARRARVDLAMFR